MAANHFTSTSQEQSAVRLEALFSPAPITLQNLVVVGMSRYLYEFMGHVLAPGKLQGLATSPSWRDDIPYLHRFLRSPAAQNLRSLTVSPYVECLYHPPPGVPEALFVRKIFGAAIAQCTRVQYLRLGLVECPSAECFLAPLSTVCPLLANLPASLRAFSLHIWITITLQESEGWARAVRSWNTLMNSLAAVDRALDPAGEEGKRRFQHLRRIELHVHFWSVGESARNGDAAEKHERQGDIERVAAAAMPLPRLKAAGLLREFLVDNVVHARAEECGEIMADVYWPSDSET
ncbi:hypothetical protein GSI_11487 [Ganoderma sinense ZZ0214-1]|uniref:Uncharacterized protein n=1 Tax=Ganoderma sinense ZZ0214-1 TaxID=1077348 RepID=A0A2G8RW67_9APHY|nr:hypothetical protein GSI_11487 [Ganoderma sinense ZZ0214-1]